MLLFGGGLFGYALCRAIMLGFTHDESLTFLNYATMPWRDIIGATSRTANNHLLNSLLVRLCFKVFGTDPLWLRLPNLAAFAMYLTGSGLIVRRLGSRGMRVHAFLLLNLLPYQLDFFSLARGYGLSLGFFIMAMLFLIRALEKDFAWREMIAVGLFGALAVLSNLNALIPYTAIVVVAVPAIIIRRGRINFHLAGEFAPLLLMSTALYLYTVPILLRLQKAEELYLGTNTLRGSFSELIRANLYMDDAPLWLVAGTGAIIAMGFIGAVCACVVKFTQAGLKAILGVGIALPILIVALCGVIASHFLGSPYPVPRTWLIFMPLYFLSILFGFDALWRMGPLRLDWTMLMGNAVLLLGMNFISVANLSYCRDWKYDADTRRMMVDLVREASQTGFRDRRMVLRIPWELEPATNFYRSTWNMVWLAWANRNGLRRQGDFWYLRPEDSALLGEMNSKVIRKYETTGNLLAVRDISK